MKISIGEAQITPEHLKRLAPDVVSGSGVQQMYAKFKDAITNKSELDKLLTQIAQKHGADFESRIKNVQTAAQKIVQKRLEGRKYGISDINDAYGARIVTDDKGKIAQIAKDIASLSKNGPFAILKSEQVKDGTYSAHHIDIQHESGGKGEIQLTTPQQELEAVANHSLRAVYGAKPPDIVQSLQKRQSTIAKKAESSEAKEAVKQIQKTAQAHDNKPVDPRTIAQIIANSVR